MLKHTLQRLSAYVQKPTGSYKRHDNQYREPDKLEKERQIGADNLERDIINSSGLLVPDLLDQHPSVQIAVDIGSGTGWSAAALSTLVPQVIAIEPSAAALEIAKTLYPTEQYPNITWQEGMAEAVLQETTLSGPTLFITGCVFNHLRDKEVQEICHAMSTQAPVGSIFSFSENWGDTEWHQLMWHVRTKDWWQNALPDWELDFHGPEVPEATEHTGRYHKGIHGVKIK